MRRVVAVVLVGWALLGCRAVTGAVAPVPPFDHVIVVVFENKELGSVLGSRDAPTFNLYARTYARMTRYYGVAHPSLPNYLALVSGSTFGYTTDCTDCPVAAQSLADTIDASGRTWKAYAEGLPSAGFLGAFSGEYAKKHNPFAYFRPIIDDAERVNQMVPFPELSRDVAARTLPDFAFVVPDLCNSMHDCSVSVGDRWLRKTVGPLLRLPRTVIFITFDEGMTSARGGGHVAALAVGTMVKRHSTFKRLTGHYGLLRTIEQAWGLPRLGASARAAPITGIWRWRDFGMGLE
jgi:phosphatidylinositol-3-phosphatase